MQSGGRSSCSHTLLWDGKYIIGSAVNKQTKTLNLGNHVCLTGSYNQLDDAMMSEEQVQRINIKSRNSVSKTVTKCLATLHQIIPPSIVEIVADAKVASKAITITEIVKRRISEHGGKIIQTTHIEERPSSEAPMEQAEVEEGEITHLQGKGYEQPKSKVIAQLVIRLERERVHNTE